MRDGEDEVAGCIDGKVERVDARGLLIGVGGRAVEAFGENEIAVGVELHAEAVAEGDLGVAADGNANEQDQRCVVGGEMEVEAVPCEAMLAGPMVLACCDCPWSGLRSVLWRAGLQGRR